MDTETQKPATCSTPDCSRPAKTKGQCPACYAKARREALREKRLARSEEKRRGKPAPRRSPAPDGLDDAVLKLADLRDALRGAEELLVSTFDYTPDRAKALITRFLAR